MMNALITKKHIIPFVVLLWFVVSLAYIGQDLWSDFKNQKLKEAYQAGQTDTVNALITEAEKCQPFMVYSGEKQVQLINLGCQQNTSAETGK